jgi:hypothetical protein
VGILTLEIEGKRGTVMLGSLLDTFKHSLAVLHELDSAISERPRGSLDWYVQDMSANGRLRADIIALPKSGKFEDTSAEVAYRFVNGLELVEREASIPPYFSEDALLNVEKLANQLGRRGAMGFGAEISVKTKAQITRQAAVNAGQAIKPKFVAVGSVTGTLEVISLHGRSTFNVYESVSGAAVRCDFDRDLHLEKVKQALGRRVRAHGVISRNSNGDAVRLAMQDLDILPEDRSLPSIRDIYGIDPQYSGGQKSEEFVRWLREA